MRMLPSTLTTVVVIPVFFDFDQVDKPITAIKKNNCVK